jgi:putative transposase
LSSGLTVNQLRSLLDIKDSALSLTRQAELLGISRSGIYYQPRPVNPFNLTVMAEIDRVYTDCPFYGARRIARELKRGGLPVNRKRIVRLMRFMGIEAIYPKKNLSLPDKQHRVYPYLLKGLTIDRPNQVWGVDITYIRLRSGWAYLVALMDWYTRFVLAWRLSDSLGSEFCVEALAAALKINLPGIHNSDQGSQLTSLDYLGQLEAHPSIRISMDGRGRAFDNIFIERLWRTVKYEEVYLKEYVDYDDARSQLNHYFRFYNQRRLHSAINYQTPAEVYFKGGD